MEHQGKAALARGTRLGKYEIERLVGVGSMGAIYKGVHTETRKRVAIKLLSPVLAAIPTVRARFLDEARLTARVRHPHIIDVSDVGEDEGRSYFAMEMLEGEDLARRLQRVRKISAADAADIVRPVCDAVAEAHRCGITHRDLKPSNIFLSIRHGRLHPIVLDFGIAKHDGEANAADAAGVPARAAMFGTPYYLAPEQIADHRAAGPASDQYALGVILYECLTGYPPFGGDSLEAVTRAIAAGNPVPPSKRRSDIPPDLDAVVLRALSLDPKARFASVAELGKALLPFASSATGNTPTPIQRTPSSPAIDLEAATPSPFRRTLTPELQMVQARHAAAENAAENAAADDAADEVTNELTNPVRREPARQATNEAVHEAAHEAAHEARNEAWFAAGEALGDGTGEAPRGRLGRSAEWSGMVESAASRKIRIGAAAGVALAGLVVLFVATRGGSSSAQRPESQPLPATAIVQSEPAPVKPPAENAAVPPAEDPPIAATPVPTAVLPAAPAPSEPPAAPPPSDPAVAAPPAPPTVAVQGEPPAAKPAAEPPAAKPAPEPLAAKPAPEPPAAKPAPEPPAAVAVQSDPPPAAKPARAPRPVEVSRARKPAGSPRSRTSAGVRMHNGVPLLD